MAFELGLKSRIFFPMTEAEKAISHSGNSMNKNPLRGQLFGVFGESEKTLCVWKISFNR